LKLFQIEEPEGGPADPNVPGAAIGIDARSPIAEVAASVGGNADNLRGFDGGRLDVPSPTAAEKDWQRFFEVARFHAERALARPVTHAVISLDGAPDEALERRLSRAAERAGLVLLRIASGLSAAEAARTAEDLLPRP
jgi:hypothetical protein